MKISGLWCLGLLAALPALAGEAYVPFVAAEAPLVDSGRSTTPTIELFNRGATPRRYAVLFTPAGAPAGEDGTKVREPVGSRWLGAGGVLEGPVATASLGILTLERSPATCSVVIGFYGADGFPDLVEFVVPPLSVAAFPDLFAWDIQQRGRPDPFEMRARATCDRIFYPFGINFVGALQIVAGRTQLAIHGLEFVVPGLPIPNP